MTSRKTAPARNEAVWQRHPTFPRMTVGVMGSAGGIIDPQVRQRIRKLGEIIAQRGYVLITGACPGIPHEAVRGSKEHGGVVVGVSPALNLGEHVARFHSPTRGYDAIIYTGSGLMGREIENIRSCDVVVFAGGRSGTLGEYAIAYDEGRVIGVLEGSGGISEHIKEITAMVEKETGAVVCYSRDPEDLMNQLEAVYRQRIEPKHVAALEGRDPDGVVEP